MPEIGKVILGVGTYNYHIDYNCCLNKLQIIVRNEYNTNFMDDLTLKDKSSLHDTKRQSPDPIFRKSLTVNQSSGNK